MDQTFITIHNLTSEANILFVSDSITDILGYQPHEVQNKSCFDFFHPDEVPFARSIHSRGVLLDKAAVLHYARVLSRGGSWVSCECCFTIVHDVLVASTSINRHDEKSQRRAIEAPQIRRLFSCSSRDPRYHMLEHLSPKFRVPGMEREPRAALILNRFTRSLSIMFSTTAVATILGLSPEDLQNQSFYDCIQESCLDDAYRCLEGAKANDSIAYLRFWSRDPHRPEEAGDENRNGDGDLESQEELLSTITPHVTNGPRGESDFLGRAYSRTIDDSEGEEALRDASMGIDYEDRYPPNSVKIESSTTMEDTEVALKRPSSENSVRRLSEIPLAGSSLSSLNEDWPTPPRGTVSMDELVARCSRCPVPSFELEAVVSCTSDGLVVVLRRARPPKPSTQPPQPSAFDNGLFVAPWPPDPIRTGNWTEESRDGDILSETPPVRTPENVPGSRGPLEDMMMSIRDVAVFAWALVGINESLAAYSQGLPQHEAILSDGSCTRNDYPGASAPPELTNGDGTKSGQCFEGSAYEGYLETLPPESCSCHRTTGVGGGCGAQYSLRGWRAGPHRIPPRPSVPVRSSGLRSRASTGSLQMPESVWYADKNRGHRWGCPTRNRSRRHQHPAI